MQDKESELENKSIQFLEGINNLLATLSVNKYPGRYIWTPYSFTNTIMHSTAIKLDKPEYFGLSVSDSTLIELETLIDQLSTEMISYIEDNDLVQQLYNHNKTLVNIRFLTNRDFSNRPVIWFNGVDRFYSAFINPSIYIPKRIEKSK